MTDVRQALVRSLAEDGPVRAVRFDPEARSFAAYRLSDTKLLGELNASDLKAACAEATERWAWDRGDRLGIRETGQEDAPRWPFDKQPVDRLHIYAVRRSASIGRTWNAKRCGYDQHYRYNLDPICTVDLRQLNEQAQQERAQFTISEGEG